MTEPKPPVVVFCERLDNESFCASIVHELGAYYDVRPCGPGWEHATLVQVDAESARFVLELDAASGAFVRPEPRRQGSAVPRVAWLIDTHKKPEFHRQISAESDLTLHAMQAWGHVLHGVRAWLPVHCDERLFCPRDVERDLDLVFVGSQAWRAEPLERIAARHGLRLLVTTTTGPREKSETAAFYARSKLVFNRHVGNDLNFRVVEAQACGRVLLTDAQHNGQYELFADGRHYVLYKDERDLERQVLRYLADDEARARIERAAAEHAREHHTTRARVAQLHEIVEAFLARRPPARAPRPARRTASRAAPRAAAAAAPAAVAAADATPAAAVNAPAALEPGAAGPAPRRWLVVAGAEPATVELRTYAELLARDLAARSAEVTVLRARRRQSAAPVATLPGAPDVVEVELGPLPAPETEASQLLAQAAALQRRADRVARERGPYEGVLAEGPLGALVGAELAARLGVPFHLALERCEVARRQNRLTREQLYLAELEHWGVERAAAVWTPSEEVADAVRRYYEAARVSCVVPAWPALAPPELRERLRLLAALGLPAAPALAVLGPPPPQERPRSARPDAPVLFLGSGLWVWQPDGSLERLGRRDPRGPALAALLMAAGRVVALEADDPRVREAEALGALVQAWPAATRPDFAALAALTREEVLCAAQ
ncbi:MAG: glycosyltransferase [Vicinamibacteria bacterium]